MHTIPSNDSRIRLLSRVIREVLAGHAFDDHSELKAAVRRRCGALGIPCGYAQLDDALSLVGTNVELLTAAPPLVLPKARTRHVEHLIEDVRPLSRDEAEIIHTRLLARFDAERQARGERALTDAEATQALGDVVTKLAARMDRA